MATVEKVASNGSVDKHSDLEKHVDSSSLSSDSHIADPVLDRKVWRKLDSYLLPVVAMFYLLSFLVSHDQLFISYPYADATSHRIARMLEMQEWLASKKTCI